MNNKIEKRYYAYTIKHGLLIIPEDNWGYKCFYDDGYETKEEIEEIITHNKLDNIIIIETISYKYI